MKMNDSNSMTPSCEDIKNSAHGTTQICPVISIKEPHKICALNTNESPIGLSCSSSDRI